MPGPVWLQYCSGSAAECASKRSFHSISEIHRLYLARREPVSFRAITNRPYNNVILAITLLNVAAMTWCRL